MIIRPGTLEDIDKSIELMREFQLESLGNYGFNINVEQAQELVRQYVAASFVVEVEGKIVGVIAGTIITFPLDGSKIFQEVVWFVSKSYRSCGVRLLKHLENHCKENGINHIVMAHMSNSKSDKLREFYLRCGFQEMEVHYIKSLG